MKLPDLDLAIRPLWYMASPYTKYPGGKTMAFTLACKKAAELMEGSSYAIFSPIAHSHPIDMHGKLPPTHDFWLGQDVVFLHAATGLFVYMMPGWRESDGVQWEIEWITKAHKPIVYLPFEGDAL